MVVLHAYITCFGISCTTGSQPCFSVVLFCYWPGKQTPESSCTGIGVLKEIDYYNQFKLSFTVCTRFVGFCSQWLAGVHAIPQG